MFPSIQLITIHDKLHQVNSYEREAKVLLNQGAPLENIEIQGEQTVIQDTNVYQADLCNRISHMLDIEGTKQTITQLSKETGLPSNSIQQKGFQEIATALNLPFNELTTAVLSLLYNNNLPLKKDNVCSVIYSLEEQGVVDSLTQIHQAIEALSFCISNNLPITSRMLTMITQLRQSNLGLANNIYKLKKTMLKHGNDRDDFAQLIHLCDQLMDDSLCTSQGVRKKLQLMGLISTSYSENIQTLKGEDMAQRQDLLSLLINLLSQYNEDDVHRDIYRLMEKTAAQLCGQKAANTSKRNSGKDNSQVNSQEIVFVIPMFHNQSPLEARVQLYYEENKSNTANNTGKFTALLKLDMDHLGPLEISLTQSSREQIDVHIRIEKNEYVQHVKQHIPMLEHQLSRLGYTEHKIHCMAINGNNDSLRRRDNGDRNKNYLSIDLFI